MLGMWLSSGVTAAFGVALWLAARGVAKS